jgi:hypothetical protein
VESDATVVVLSPPDMGLAGGERRVGELDRDRAGAVDREVPAGGVAQVGFALWAWSPAATALIPVFVPYA